jgi:hypothetical protein
MEKSYKAEEKKKLANLTKVCPTILQLLNAYKWA